MPRGVVLQLLTGGVVNLLQVQRVALTAVSALHVRVSDAQGTPLDRDVRDGVVVEADTRQIVLRRDHVLPTHARTPTMRVWMQPAYRSFPYSRCLTCVVEGSQT